MRKHLHLLTAAALVLIAGGFSLLQQSFASGISQAIIPQAVPTAYKQGTGTKFQIAGTVSGTGSVLCTDSNGNTATNLCTSLAYTSVAVPPAATAALGAAGALTGDVTYYISYVTAQGETLVGAASNTVNPVAQRVTVTIPVSTDPRVTGRNIYRAGSIDPGGPYRLTSGTTVTDNTTLTYDDNIAWGGSNHRKPTTNSTSSTITVDSTKAGFANVQQTSFGLGAMAAIQHFEEEGNFESAFGWEALNLLTAGKFNTAIGARAMRASTGTESNTCVGTVACENVYTGTENTTVGSHTLRTGGVNTSYNTAIGSYSMNGASFSGTGGNGNTALGASSLRDIQAGGTYNTALGMNAGYPSTSANNLKTGAYNVLVGYATGMNGSQFSNCGAYGKGALCLASNGVYMGPNGGPDQQTFVAAHITSFGTAPAIASGFGTTPAIAGNDNGGRITVGTGGTAATGVINFGVVWSLAPACTANNETAIQLVQAIASTTQLTLTSSSAWGAADKLTWTCIGY